VLATNYPSSEWVSNVNPFIAWAVATYATALVVVVPGILVMLWASRK